MPALGWKNVVRGLAAGIVLSALGYAAAAHGGIVLSDGESHAWDSTARPIDARHLHESSSTPFDFDGYTAGDLTKNPSPLKHVALARYDDDAEPAGYKPAPAEHSSANSATSHHHAHKPEPQVLTLSLQGGVSGAPASPQVIAAVPEPASMSLLFAASLGLLRRTRRK